MARIKQLAVDLEENRDEIDELLEQFKTSQPFLYRLLFDDTLSWEDKVFSLRQEGKVERELACIIVDGITMNSIKNDIVEFINENRGEIDCVLNHMKKTLRETFELLFMSDTDIDELKKELQPFCFDEEMTTILTTAISMGYINNEER